MKDAPVEDATCASLCGQLVAIGGENDCPAINAYDSNKDRWYEIGKLAAGRSQISENTLVVVGGKGRVNWWKSNRDCYRCYVNWELRVPCNCCIELKVNECTGSLLCMTANR